MVTQIQIELVEGLELDALRALHSCAGASGRCPMADELFRMGVSSLSPVHELTEDEIRDDAYGFAREFRAILNSTDAPTRMMDAIRELRFVKSCSRPDRQSGC